MKVGNAKPLQTESLTRAEPKPPSPIVERAAEIAHGVFVDQFPGQGENGRLRSWARLDNRARQAWIDALSAGYAALTNTSERENG